MKLNLEELKKIELNILKEFIRFCEDNKLEYVAAYGTTLGAIRHQGFIPWDDDIDIMMPRESYEKLLEIYDNNKEKYKIISNKNNKDFFSMFAKLYDDSTTLIQNYGSVENYSIGVNIDIFPIDGLPIKYKKACRHIKKIKLYYFFLSIAVKDIKTVKGKAIIKKLKIMFIKVIHKIGYSFFQKKIDILSKKYDYSTSRYVGVVSFGEGIKEIIKKKEFEPYNKAKFEDLIINVPNNYELYLKNIYGNWKELPPEEKRITKHNFEVFYK